MISGAMAPPKYAVGQIWNYHTRPQDVGSLVKIQQFEMMDGKPVYHVSIIGVHLGRRDVVGTLPHLPVSDVTLDASVTQQSVKTGDFPESVAEGMAEWRRAHGGGWTIPLDQIVEVVDAQLRAAELPLTGTQR